MLEANGEKGENNLLVSRCDIWHQVLVLLHDFKSKSETKCLLKTF